MNVDIPELAAGSSVDSKQRSDLASAVSSNCKLLGPLPQIDRPDSTFDLQEQSCEPLLAGRMAHHGKFRVLFVSCIGSIDGHRILID